MSEKNVDKENLEIDRILRADEVVEITGLSRTTIWRLERSGDFPPRRHLSSFAVGWILSEIKEWLTNRQKAQSKNIEREKR